MDKDFKTTHHDGRVKGLKKSLVILNKRISQISSGIMYEPDTKHCQRSVEALILEQATQWLH